MGGLDANEKRNLAWSRSSLHLDVRRIARLVGCCCGVRIPATQQGAVRRKGIHWHDLPVDKQGTHELLLRESDSPEVVQGVMNWKRIPKSKERIAGRWLPQSSAPAWLASSFRCPSSGGTSAATRRLPTRRASRRASPTAANSASANLGSRRQERCTSLCTARGIIRLS